VFQPEDIPFLVFADRQMSGEGAGGGKWNMRLLCLDKQTGETVYRNDKLPDAAVTRFLGWRTHTALSDTQVFLACCDAEWRQTGVGPYLIISRDTGTLLGSTGLRLSSPQQAATGYVLARDAWGQGYATEALHAMRDLALRLGVLRLTAVCHPEHRASWRVMQKCGFSREGTLRGHAQFPNHSPGVASDVLCFSFIFDTEWQPLVI
jgi:RimJ/RimL family protein N-acetyltransferase